MVSVALLFISRFITLIGSPLIGLLVVRYLGPDTYGLYASALAITGLFGFLCDFGVQQTVLRFGVGEQQLGPVLKRGSLVSLTYTIAAFGFILVWTVLFDYDQLVVQLVAIQSVGLVRFPLLTLVTAGLQLRGEYGRIAFWNLGTTSVQWIATLVSMALGSPVLLLSAVPIAVSLGFSLLMIIVEGRRLGVFHQPGLAPGNVTFLKESWKFGVAGTMYQIYQKSDVAILSVFREPLEVGHYSVAMRLVDLSNAVPRIIFNQVLFPKYFWWSESDRRRLQTFYKLTTKIMLLLGMTVAASMILFGTTLISLLFDLDIHVFGIIIPVLAVGVMFHFWAASPGAILTTDGHVTRKVWIQGLVAGLNVLLNIILIPTFGIVGAAVVFTVSKIILAYMYSRDVHLRAGFVVFPRLRKRVTFFLYVVGSMVLMFWLSKSALMIKSTGLALGFLVGSGVMWSKYMTDEERREIVRFLMVRRYHKNPVY